MSQSISRIGIDLAKNIFQVCAVDAQGKVLFNKTVSRPKLSALMAQWQPTEVVMEACASAHHWTRVFERMGHRVKLIHPAYVRPYVKTNKNDAADAEALCEAASRPQMRFVQPKNIQQQDIQAMHRVRERLVGQRTALTNQIRGLLGEYGLTLPQGVRNIRKQLPWIIEDAENDLTPVSRRLFQQLYNELCDLDQRVKEIKQDIEAVCESLPPCQGLLSIPGVGPMVATALHATMGSPENYRNGREFAAYLGLVPRQYSSGGKPQLGGISKRGDPHTRMLLIQGAQAALRVMPKRQDKLSLWACKLKQRKQHSVAVVALANKLARISWAVSQKQTSYNAGLA